MYSICILHLISYNLKQSTTQYGSQYCFCYHYSSVLMVLPLILTVLKILHGSVPLLVTVFTHSISVCGDWAFALSQSRCDSLSFLSFHFLLWLNWMRYHTILSQLGAKSSVSISYDSEIYLQINEALKNWLRWVL